MRRDLALLPHLYTIAIKEWGMPVDNPCAKIRKPKLNKDRERRVIDGELADLLEAAGALHVEMPKL